jgi:predicted PurR-regulated permease PerM
MLWWIWQLSTILLLLSVAVILAVALDSPVSWVERRHLSRSAASLIVTGGLVITVTAFLWVTWSSLINQWQYLTAQLTVFARDLSRMLPQWVYPDANSRDVRDTVQPYLLGAARSTAEALTLIVLGLFVTVYLLIDGRRTLAWVVAFVPQRSRDKVEQTLSESRDVIWAYVTGNVITSLFAAGWVLVWMLVLHVPAALLLAVIAGLADFVPVLGFIVSVVPAAALALTVSPRTALITLALWVIYHAIENYLIAPWAYGTRLKLSDLAVILAFVIGAELAGVIGALIALPIAALYPTIERIWLREQLPRETVTEHRKLSRSRPA